MHHDSETPIDPIPGLPSELASLDGELAALDIGERASFAPELAAELRRAVGRQPERASPMLRRSLAAAAAVLFLAVCVPQARAALVNATSSLARLLDGASSSATQGPGSDPRVAAPERTLAPQRPLDAAPLDFQPPVHRAPAPLLPPAAEPLPFRALPATLPGVLDAASDARLMRRYYPPDLRLAGVGGTVHLMLWVDSAGAVNHVQIRRGSGLPGLDEAALAAAPHLRFRPATLGGRPVGTWVEFPLTFEVVPPAQPAAPVPVEVPAHPAPPYPRR